MGHLSTRYQPHLVNDQTCIFKRQSFGYGWSKRYDHWKIQQTASVRWPSQNGPRVKTARHHSSELINVYVLESLLTVAFCDCSVDDSVYLTLIKASNCFRDGLCSLMPYLGNAINPWITSEHDVYESSFRSSKTLMVRGISINGWCACEIDQ